MKKTAVILASGFGSGFVPMAPGTWGTLVGCAVVYLISLISPATFQILMVVTLGIFTAAGYWAIKNLPSDWIHDDQRIVVDEMVGLFVAMIFLPFSFSCLFGAFVLFRIFDIWKPMGIRKFDKLNSSWSVLVDDLLAGVYANLALRLILLISARI